MSQFPDQENFMDVTGTTGEPVVNALAEGAIAQDNSLTSTTPEPSNVEAVDSATVVRPSSEAAKAMTLDKLTKGRGYIVTETVEGASMPLWLCKNGKIGLFEDEKLIVVCLTKVAKEVAAIPGAVNLVSRDTEEIFTVPISEFKAVKRVLRPRRRISDEVRKQRSERMKKYWENKRSAVQQASDTVQPQ